MTGTEFRNARKALGLSTSQLAGVLNINKRTIERIEHGEGCSTVMGLAMQKLADDAGTFPTERARDE